MPQISFDKIKSFTAVGKTTTNIVKTAQDDNINVWDRIGKLLEQTGNFIDKYQNLKESQQPQNIIDAERLDLIPPAQLPIGSPPPVINQNTQISKILDTIIPMLSPFIDQCIAISPDMPLGQMIARLDMLSAKEVKALLQLYQAQRKRK